MGVKAEHACIHGKQYAKAGGGIRQMGEEVQDTRGMVAMAHTVWPTGRLGICE